MLVITLGDPFSVSVELLAPLLARGATGDLPVTLIGSLWQWQDQSRRLALPELPRRVTFLDVGDATYHKPAEKLTPKERGELARRNLETLKTLPRSTRLAVVTAPIDKHAAQAAGYTFPGQTEFFEVLWGHRAVMTLAGPRLRVGLVTNHLPLAAVSGAITKSLVEMKLELFLNTLRESFGIAQPRVAVAGLNPHAGDQGLFGDEDRDIIAPVVAAMAARHPDATITGPVAADTVFYRAYQGRYDGVLAMYHDQGLGPLKTVHFDDAVNLSGGLPHFRASPDHGPASDLFLKGAASGKSFAAALALARHYLESEA